MKIVILGGTGVFGSRLARLLRRDGHSVTLAARRGADALAAEIGADSLRHDRSQDPAPLFAAAPDLLIDATGPFQHYGPDPYRLARAAIDAGVDYMDLSDDADFTAGIVELDAVAQAAGRVVLSGMSSVPALSGAAVMALAEGMTAIDAIDGAILPGNRAPRGHAVMAAILHQAGRPMRVWHAGIWEMRRGWSDCRAYPLLGGGTRHGWLNRVPDLELFPSYFRARSVTFRAGLELPVMGRSLALLSVLRRVIRLPVPVGLAHRVASVLERLGTDRGGMVVTVSGDTPNGAVIRHWHLAAEEGEGPFVPAIPARAAVAAWPLRAGARAAIAEIPLAAMERAMADLAIRTERAERRAEPLFSKVLGADFEDLPKQVQDTHKVITARRLSGLGRVSRGRGLWPRLIAFAFRFPPAGEAVRINVLKTRKGDTETWVRRFGRTTFRSTLKATPDGMTERFGPFTFELGLHVDQGTLRFPVKGGRIGTVRIPSWALPQSEAHEFVSDGTFRFDVTLRAPVTRQFIIRYEGALGPVD
ncbi:MAG: DUF4166 domain-containing protein [Pseudomonadota bacterium]